jgi:hypothetical protein
MDRAEFHADQEERIKNYIIDTIDCWVSHYINNMDQNIRQLAIEAQEITTSKIKNTIEFMPTDVDISIKWESGIPEVYITEVIYDDINDNIIGGGQWELKLDNSINCEFWKFWDNLGNYIAYIDNTLCYKLSSIDITTLFEDVAYLSELSDQLNQDIDNGYYDNYDYDYDYDYDYGYYIDYYHNGQGPQIEW